MICNTPWNRSRKFKSKMYRDYPDDLRPSAAAALGAHLGTAWEFGMPLLLLLSDGGTIGTIALIGMLMFHVHIFSTFAMGVPMEWNLFMLFGLCFLFGEYGDYRSGTSTTRCLIAAARADRRRDPGRRQPPAGQDLLPALDALLRGQLGDEMWLFRKDTGAEEKFDREIYKVAPIAVEQLAKIYDAETANYILEKGLAFRAMHSHGRALNALFARAAAPRDVDDYFVREGEVISGIVTGWNFGDGHFHHEQLLDAVQRAGAVRAGRAAVVMLESQPAHIQRQHYRIHDAATGLIEEGWINVRDMIERGPWLEECFEFPVEVTAKGREPPEPAPVA